MAFPVNPVNGQQATVNGVVYIWDSAIPAWVVFTSTAADFSGNNLAVTHNITSATLTALGNVTGANLLTGGLISATGNITGSNLLFGSGNVSGTGNIYANRIYANISGNIDAAGSNTWVQFADTGDVLGASAGFTFDKTANLLTVSGNVQGGNLLTTGLISSTGNVIAANYNTLGNASVGGNVTTSSVNLSGAGGVYWDYGSQIVEDGISHGLSVVGATSLALGSSGDVTLVSNGITATYDTSGNLSLPGNVSATGNLIAGNLTGTLVTGTLTTAAQPNVTSVGTLSSLSVTANVTSGNVTTGIISATGTISAANITGDNILTAGIVSATGNITGNYIFGNGSQLTGIDATSIQNGTSNVRVANNGNVTVGIAGTSNVGVFTTTGLSVTGEITATGNVTAGNVAATLITGTLTTAAQPNITSTGTLTSLSVTGNVTSGNVTTGIISATGTINAGNITGSNLITSGLITSTGNITSGNVLTGGEVSATGNVTTGNVVTGGAITATGNITAGNVVTGGAITATGNITAGNLSATLITGTLTTNAQPNVTAVGTLASLSVAGDTQLANLQTTGNAIIGGNLIVNGNTTYINIVDLNVQDPLISLGGGANGAPLTTNDGKDRGVLDEYYTDAAHTAWMGWQNTTGNLVAANNVSVANNIITVNSYGTFQVGQLYAGSNILTPGNINSSGNLSVTGNAIISGNITTGNITANVYGWANTVTNNAQPNITSVGTLTSLSVSGNVIAGNLSVVGVTADTGNVTAGNLLTGGLISATGNIYSNAVSVTSNVFTPQVTNLTGAVGITANTKPWTFSDNGNLYTPESGQIRAGSPFYGISLVDYSDNSYVAVDGSGTYIQGNSLVRLRTNGGTEFDFSNGQLNAGAATITTTGNVVGANFLTAGLVSATGNIQGNVFIGNGAGLTNINAANLIGAYSNANVANYLPTFSGNVGGTLTTNAQPYVTSVGTLSSLSVTANIASGNITTGRITATGNISTSANLSVTGNTNIVGNLFVTGNVYANIANVSGNAGVFYGDAAGFGALYAGIASGYVYQPDTIAQFSANTNEFAQINLQNINAGNAASTDIVATADSGDNYHFYVDMGITSSTYDGLSANALGTILRPNDAFLYTVGDATNGSTDGGNLVIATATPDKSIKIATGGTDADIVVQITAGNASVVGNVNATGDIVGASISTTGNIAGNFISASGNVKGGNVLASGSISAAGNLTANNVSATLVAGTLTTAAQPNITSVGALTSVTVTGNTQGGNLLTAGQVSATGNIQGNVFIGNGAGLTNINAANLIGAYSNSNVANYLPTYSGNLENVNSITATGNIYTGTGIIGTSGDYVQPNFVQPNQTDPNWSFGIDGDGSTEFWMQAQFNGGQPTHGFRVYDNNNLTVPFSVDGMGNTAVNGNLSVSGNIATGNIDSSNVTASNVSATGNVTAAGFVTSGSSGNITGANVISATTFTASGDIYGVNASLSGNTQSGNLLTDGYVSATGNVTGDYILGNGAFLSGVITSVANINNGTSNISVYNNGNITVGVSGVGNTVVFTPTGIQIASTVGNVIYTTGNIAGGYLFGNGAYLSGIPASYGNANVAAYLPTYTGVITAATPSADTNNTVVATTAYVTAAVTAAGGYGNAQVAAYLPTYTGNLAGGNLDITGDVSITGNLTIGANLNVVNINEFVGASGNISFLGNLLPATSGNTNYDLGLPGIPWGNIYATNLDTVGNFSTGNLLATSVVSAAGNVIGNYVLSNGAIFTNNVTVTGTITAGNINANVTGTITDAINVTGNNQPNITTVGTLTSLSVIGNVTGGNLITTGTASIAGFTISANTITSQGPTLTIDPNASGGIDGNVVVQGNLIVNGNMTYINSNNITTNDLTINMANNAATATAANGGGIGVGPAGSEYISLTYNSASNIWVASNGMSVQGAVQTQANISGANVVTGGRVTATGNVYGNVFVGNGAGLTSVVGANVTGTVANATYALSAGSAVGTAATVTTNAQPNITSVGTLTSLSVTGNVTSGNVSATLVTGTLTTVAQPNITSVGTLASVTSTGLISTTGNVSGNYIIGDGSLLSNINAGNIVGSYGNANVANYLPTFTGNLTANNISTIGSVTAPGNVYTPRVQNGGSGLTVDSGYPGYISFFNGTGNTVTIGDDGNLSAVGNVVGANFLTGGLISSTGNITGGNVSATLVTGTLTTAAQPNVTSVGALTAVTVTGNAVAGNVLTAGFVSAAGNITAANVITTVTLTATGNAYAVNMLASANISATGTVFAGNLSIVGNTQSGNLLTAGLISATGNVQGNVFTGNGAGLTNLNAANLIGAYGNSNVAAYLPTNTANIGTGNIVFSGPNALITGNFDSSNNSRLLVQSTANRTTLAVIPNAGYAATATGNITVSGAYVYNAVDAENSAYVGVQINPNYARLSSLKNGTADILPLVIDTDAGNAIVIAANSTAVTMPGNLSVAGNITGNYFFGNGSLLTGIITSVANINNGNTNVTAYANGNVAVTVAGTANTVVFTDTGIEVASAAGNVISTTGNISAGYLYGNGSQLTGLSANSIGNVGNCSVVANTPDGNVNISADGVANLATFNLGTMTMLGAYANPNQIDISVSVIGNVNGMMVGPIAFGPSGNIQIPDSSRIIIL